MSFYYTCLMVRYFAGTRRALEPACPNSIAPEEDQLPLQVPVENAHGLQTPLGGRGTDPNAAKQVTRPYILRVRRLPLSPTPPPFFFVLWT